jgi:hypothetical protein
MNKSKLYKLYCTLDKKALRQFKKWVCSPIHNEHVLVEELFAFINTRSSYTATTLSKERAWKYFFPNKAYNDLRMRHIMSNAYNVLINFVRYNLLKKTIFVQEKMLATYLFEHKIEKEAQKSLAAAARSLKKEIPNESYYYYQYELEVLKLEEVTKQNRTNGLNIVPILDHARLFFMITTLKYACTAMEHQNLSNVAYEIPLLDSILEEVKEGNYDTYPLLKIYYYGYLSLKKPEDTSHFFALKNYLKDNRLTAEQQKSTLLMCINFMLKKINTGKIEYARETFELYQYGINTQCLLDGEDLLLSVFTYKNIVTLGLNLKEYDWIEAFIDNYSQYLPKELRANYKHFNTAKLAFDKGNFAKAMGLLLQVEYDELLLNVDAKVILLKIYYQEESYNALDALLDSFRMFLHRQESLPYIKRNYINLMLFIKKLLVTSFDNQEIEKLKKEINTTPQLAERKWLLEQLKMKRN